VQRRAQQLKATREPLLTELAGVRRDHSLPVIEHIKPSQVEIFGKALREKLLANDSSLARAI